MGKKIRKVGKHPRRFYKRIKQIKYVKNTRSSEPVVVFTFKNTFQGVKQVKELSDFDHISIRVNLRP